MVCFIILTAFTKTLAIAGQDYQLELIDTAGQDELSIVSGSHLMNLDGYILVYSVTSERR
jgi:Ras homolog enriched in brain